MAFRRDDMAPELKDVQIYSSWVPTTPAKPHSTREQPICSNWQENQLVNVNWLEPELFTGVNQADWSETGQLSNNFLQETQCQTIPTCYNSTNSISVSGGFNTWQAGDTMNSHVHGDNLSINDQFSIKDDKWTNMPFGNLLALVHGTPPAAANAVPRTDFIATSSTSAPHFHPQTGGCQYMMSFGNSSPANQDSLLGAKVNAELNIIPDIFTGGRFISSRPFFDLNSPPRTITDSTLIKNISSQLEPVTPEKTSNAEQRQESVMPDLSIDEVHTAKDAQENNEVSDEAEELHEKNKQSQLCATMSTQSLENHKPDKEGTEEADLSKTPHQKPRRKKHRPKVIIEGQPNKTPKPSTEKPTFSPETTRVKRTYVRRKGVNNLTNTTLEGENNKTDASKKPPSSRDTPIGKRKYVRKKIIDKPEATVFHEGTTDTNKRRHTRSSCRKSLNFDLESQEKDESSSYCPHSNCGMELQEKNFNAKDHSRTTVQCRQGMEVMMEKNGAGIAYELTCCNNQVLKDHLSKPQRHSPSPLPHTKMGPLQDEYMFTDQSVSPRGKCQIVFSDLTHDKEANTVQVTMNPDCQWTPKRLNDSNCCSSTFLTTEKRDRGFKRQHVDTALEAAICSTNVTGAFHNSLQTYCSIFSQNSEKNDSIHSMHFPVIYKKMRTEKGHNTATSRLQYTMTAIGNHVELETHHLRDSCTKFESESKQGYSSVAQWKATNPVKDNPAANGNQNEQKNLGPLVLGSTEWMKKKRSKGPTRIRDVASLLDICKGHPAAPGEGTTASRNAQGFEILHQPQTCMEALEVDARSTMTTKKRSKRSVHINSTVQDMYNHRGFDTKLLGPTLALNWRCMSLFDAITEQLNQLDLNAENSQVSAQEHSALMAYHMYYQERHALVPYQRGGAVIPFDSSFHQVRKRKPRPKVELDDETTRVWKLLLENINSEGIDGTDEEKTKWWEEERRIFNGRANSFIARMHLVQGDRRFSPWKGSVLDSVIGVFLTQNVSDHLSSSAFMSLAAQFPLESKINPAELHEERVKIKIKEPEKHVLTLDETSEMNGEVLNKSVCNEDPTMLQDFEYNELMVNSVKSSENSSEGIIPEDNLRSQLEDISEHGPVIPHTSAANKSLSLIGAKRDTDDAFSAQTSVISSQNSADFPIAQTTERTESSLLSILEEEPTAGVVPNRFTSPTSVVKLLQMTETVLNGVHKEGRNMFDVHEQVQPESLSLDSQKEVQCGHCTSTAISIIPCSKSTLHLSSTPGAQTSECFDLSQKKSKFSDTSSGQGLSTEEDSGLSMSSESESQNTIQKFTAVCFEEGPKLSSNNDEIEINRRIVENQMSQVAAQILLQENNCKMEASNNPIYPRILMDATGSSSNTENSKMSEHEEVDLNKNDHDYSSSNKGNVSKVKGGRIGKGKQNPIDWDSLRKQAQAGGRKTERTANTMDSVDWDAVRRADVKEVAHTIKERGMNNMLAERIKDFLNRLVREHGSLDMEWLRDVPPDKAKEYLLSVRGLGLKSVECVRLLTLHHLAFPVDTNVGRIAVRLGWVPLQPLPESLQLHLLELYPVLESIQKYLWPRLCKLDQRTLYELHYQMITFGKVFCTKSKPNCNACPVRGECRHFASAFASARLALPAPKEKSITSTTENKEAYQNLVKNMIPLQLPAPQANQMDAKSGASNSQPIIEEPATPEPAIELPATPEQSYTQVPECDIENIFYEDPDEIPTIQLNMEEFTHNLQKIMQQNAEVQEGDTSKALVALTPEAALIPVPKLKNVSQLRTEHQVYELPDSHPLLEGMDKREADDPCPYLLAIWTPGETVNSIEPPERQCGSQESEELCNDETCLSCNSIREANSLTVRGTLLIPCRTAMRGSFPLNGTYFQVNEVFSDHESSLCPMDIPRKWIWNLPRRTVYFGTSIPTIFKGLSTEGIQYCFWRGFVCVRGFDRKKRAPRPLIARLHFPSSKLARGKGKTGEN